jgi:hypothetical protein
LQEHPFNFTPPTHWDILLTITYHKLTLIFTLQQYL